MQSLPLENLVTVAATIATGLFFYFKVMSGGLAANMSIELSTQRWRAPNGEDLLTIVALLKKGEHGALKLYDLSARISTDDNVLSVKRFPSFFRQDWTRDRKINWTSGRKGRGYTNTQFLRITPGEVLQFTTLCKVPVDTPCYVEVAVLAQRDFSPFIAQWKATAVSFPIHQ